MAQLKSTAVNGNLAVTGAIYADKIAKIGGTNSQILMADGSTLSKDSVGSGNVTGSGLTENKIILGNGGVAIKVSSYGIVTSSTGLTTTSDTELPTSKAIATYVTGLKYITNSNLTGYATEQWVTNQGYTTNTGTVTGSELTKNKIILGKGGTAIQNSSYGIVTTLGTDNTTVPTSKAISTYVTGLGYTKNTGTVTSVTAGTGLSGGTITTQGKIYLADATERTSVDTNTHHLVYRDNGTGVMKYEAGVYIGGELGELHATTFKIAEKATLVYDTDKSAVKFVFS